MTRLLTRRNVIIALVAVAAIGLLAVFAWTAARGGKASLDGPTVRSIVEDDMLTMFSEQLDVTESEARELYADKELLTAVKKSELTRSEFLVLAREVAVASLQEAVDDGRITTEQADRALQMVTRAVTNHL